MSRKLKMKKIIIGAVVLSLLATPAFAKVKARDLLLGGIIGAVLVESYKEAKKNPSYNYNYNYNNTYNTYRNDPCYYTPSDYAYRYDSERAEYERGVAARQCREQEERKQRAYDCGYNGNCR